MSQVRKLFLEIQALAISAARTLKEFDNFSEDEKKEKINYYEKRAKEHKYSDDHNISGQQLDLYHHIGKMKEKLNK